MAILIKTLIKSVLSLVVMIALINKGLCTECSLENINIGTVRSGREVMGKAEWNVSVINNCGCPQRAIELSCSGFRTAEPVDRSTFLKVDDATCLLINGSSLPGFASVSFRYAWDPPVLLLPLRSVIADPC